MSEKKNFGRGRGNPGSKMEGPWMRAQKLEEGAELRRPKYEDDIREVTGEGYPPLRKSSNLDKNKKKGFEITEEGFPPLPKPSNSVVNEDAEPSTEIIPESENVKSVVEENNTCDQTVMNKNNDNSKDTDNEGSQNNNIVEDNSIKTEKGEIPVVLVINENLTVDTAAFTNVVSNLSPFAKEFIPREQIYFDTYQPEMVNLECEEDNSSKFSLKQTEGKSFEYLLQDVEESLMFCYNRLNEAPGSLDAITDIVTPDFLKVYLKEPALNQKIVESLYEFCMMDSSFSYLGVRFLVHLINSAAEKLNSTDLRDSTLKLAQREVENTLETLKRPDTDCALTNHLLHFISELYIHLKLSNRRFILVGEAVISILKALLEAIQVPKKEGLHTTVNILKLTGTYLDEDNPAILNNFMEFLNMKLENEKGNIDSNIVTLVENLIAQRPMWQTKDTVVEEDQPVTNELDYAPGVQQQTWNRAVFYGPDGHILNNEEEVFLHCNTMGQLSLDQQSEPSPSSMDGEMQDAYNEFLSMIPNSSPNMYHQGIHVAPPSLISPNMIPIAPQAVLIPGPPLLIPAPTQNLVIQAPPQNIGIPAPPQNLVAQRQRAILGSSQNLIMAPPQNIPDSYMNP